MIRTFRHKGLEQLFRTGSTADIQSQHAKQLRLQLAKLDSARTPNDMALPGWRLHRLTTGHWSVWVNGNRRMTFAFEAEDAVLVDYQDYH
jgi:proteic killer suppression protein